MNDKFESQKERLVSIKQEISLLYQQVNYLLRNEKPLELLDLDVLMNRTHSLYDQLCAINVGDESIDEDLPFDADALAGLFGGMTQEEPAQPTEEESAVVEEQAVVEEPVAEAPQPEPEPVVEPPTVVEFQPEPVKVEEPEPEPESKPLGDEFGFFFRFEDIPEKKEPEVVTEQSEGRVVHVMEAIPEEEIPERDRVNGDDLVKDNPLVMPRLDEERKAEKAEIEQQSSEGMPNFFEQDDAGFELSTGETLGEKMMGEDNSLAAKLQQNPVRDLKSVIGINDKFLFVNELKIELQWNSSNEAYLKLKELISRKFE